MKVTLKVYVSCFSDLCWPLIIKQYLSLMLTLAQHRILTYTYIVSSKSEVPKTQSLIEIRLNERHLKWHSMEISTTYKEYALQNQILFSHRLSSDIFVMMVVNKQKKGWGNVHSQVTLYYDYIIYISTYVYIIHTILYTILYIIYYIY